MTGASWIFLIALSYIFKSPLSLPCWDLHQKLGCEEAAAARDCTDIWQNTQLQGKDTKTRGKCRHCTIDTCNMPSLCFAQQQFSSLVVLQTCQTVPIFSFSACPLVQPNSISAVPSAVQWLFPEKNLHQLNNPDMFPTKEVILTILGMLEATFTFAQV